MSDPDSTLPEIANRHLDVLRNAARGGQERFLVALPDPAERQRVSAALASEGFVLEVRSMGEALAHLADEPFDLAFVTLDEDAASDPLAASRELRPFTDLVLITESDPDRCAAALGREVAAVLPRPLPEVDALLRAHVKRLAGFRRSRTRGLLVVNAFAGVRQELLAPAPDLVAALDLMAAETRTDPTILVLGDADLARAAGARTATAAPPDAVVVGVGADETLDLRLGEARARGPGAAVVMVDDAPSTDRLRTAIYGGVRAYLPRAASSLLGRIAASAAQRRRHESIGIRMIETLARFGVFSHDENDRAPPSLHQDVDVRLIAAATVRARARR